MASASASELAISSAGDPDAAMTDICEQDHPPGRCVWVMGAKNYRRERWREETTGDVESSRINVNLPRHFFMVRFELEEEYLAALTNGPWRAFGSHLVVQAWTPEFEPLRDEIVTTPVWVRLSNLPVNFYHRSILMGIARGLGKPIRVDSTTLNLERTRFTRVCVEVNLTKPFKGTVMVNGDRYFVAYEGLSNICSSCGLYGHLVHNCSKLLIEKAKNVVPAGVTDVARGSQPENDGSTVIRRSGRRPEKPDTRIAFTAGEPEADLERNIQEISENITVSNRFGGLEENMVVTEMREATILSRGDKENINQDQENIQRRGKSFDQGSDGTEVSQLIKGPSGPRGNLLPKKALVIKPNGFAGSKPKHKSVTKPTHGLVFGPTRGEIALSESGKRLRVENRAVGRLRGAFVREGDNMQVNRDHSRGDDANANRNQLVLAEEGLQKGSKTSSGLSEEETDAVINPRTNHGEDYGRETTTQEQPSGIFNQVLSKTSGQSQFSLPEKTPEPCSVQTKSKINSSCPANTWNTFSAQLPSTSKKNQPKKSSHEGVIPFTSRVIPSLPDLDIYGVIGGFRPDKKDLSYEVNVSAFLTHHRSSSSWNQVKTDFGLGDINFPNQMILGLPYLEADGFSHLQTKLWHEDEYQGVIEDEDDYGRTTWYDECVSSSDCGEEPDGEELEPEPPDYYHSSQQHTKPHTYTDHTNWVQENSYFCEEDDDADYQYHPPRREEKSHSYGLASYRVQTQSTPAGPTKPTNKRCDYTSNPLIFTGFSKDPKVYLKWENNMKQWLRSNNIPKEEKLYYALSKLKGDAYEWWLKEDAATYYTTKAVLDWGTLKSRMYREFTKKYQPRIRTTKPLYMETPKKVVTTPKLQPIFQPMNAHSHEPRRTPSSTRQTPIKAEQFVQIKEVQQDSAATLLHELQGKLNRGASHTMEKTAVLISQETTCCDLDSQAPHQSAITIQEDKTPTLKQETNSILIGNQGTKDDHKGDSLKSKEFMDQNKNREEYTPLLIKRAANGDDNFNETIQIKEKPPDEKPLQPIRGKILHPHVLQWTNLTYLCVGDQVLRTKLLEEGGYDAVINPRTNHGEDYGRETTTQEQPSGIFNQVLSKTSGQSQFSLPEKTPEPCSVQTKSKINSSCPANTWNTFSAQLPSTSKKNQPKKSSHEGVIPFTSRVIPSLPDLDIYGVIGGFRPDKKDLSYEVNVSAFLTHHRSSSSWNQVKTDFGLGDINFPNQMILGLPYLEADGFSHLQTKLWRPGEFLIQLEDPNITSSFILSHWIKWIQSCLIIHQELPYMDPRAFKAQPQRLSSDLWVTSPTDLEKLVVDYYKRLYSMDDLDSEVESLPAAGFRRLLREDLQDLSRLFTAEEVEKAIRSMGQYKAPGPDGFQPGFYQQCWDVVGLAQSSFIPGRLSMDNIVLVQEAVHSMRRKKGRKGWMLLKLDLEKAYDRIRWDFLEDTLKVSGLPEKYVGWIMQCVMGPSMNVLWNGEKTEAFKPSYVKDPRWLVAKGSWSSRWRSVGMGLREVVIPRLSWVLGDGKIIRFWTDKWLLDQPLMDLASQVVSSKEKKIRVKLQLAAMVVDNVTGAVDRVSWGGIGNGQFTVKSAYVFLTRDDSPRQWLGKLFRRVWHVKAPERVQVFLWLVVNQALMTNVERHRRHLCESGLCQVCKAGEDTIIHVLRDCLAMAEIWLRLLPPRKRQSFFTKSILEWVYDNLGVETDIVGSPWSTNFAMAVWWGWKWRCGNVFNTNRKCRDRMRFVKELAKNVSSAFVLAADSGHGPMREERMIAWKPPKSD
ncbi:hypothetical protein ISN44_As12g036090 [Arabidopsis suecica]|uniref:Uncharacterized protein n=1 Tax=Arabidopsis suecica TaxID=45249 RepID=A0A8T1YQX2_ARASU|nr:hypothetical protein ISN44_As12g036090 [Arabidopsis suecica]